MKWWRGNRQPVACGWCKTWLRPPKKGDASDALVSHGICPACVRVHFPDDAPRRRGVLVSGRMKRGLVELRGRVGGVLRTIRGGPAAW